MDTIIIVGCGSIGQRHAMNAKQIGIENIIICDINLQRLKKFATELGTTYYYSSYADAFGKHPETDAAVISTPSGIHIQPATFFAEKGIPIFIEKPLSNNLDNVDNLMEIIAENDLVAMIGQSYRFHEGFLQLKELLDRDVLGKIFHVNYFGGHYLPDWHPDQDYRKEYAAQKRLGGGVLLTSASHGFDTINWLFGEIDQITGWKTHQSNLEIDVEDSIFCLIKTRKDIIVQYQSDFIQRENKHQMIVFGEKGHISADFVKNEIEIGVMGENLERIYYDFDPNKRYVDELIYFTNIIKKKLTKQELDLSVGKKILEMIKNPNIKFI